MKLSEEILQRFREGMTGADKAGVPEPTAMTLATCSEGQPSARTVLLKDVDEDGFVFYTNLGSNKGKQLAANPSVALVFWWREIEQQVKVEGLANPVTEAEADAYFASRPRESRIGAWASIQSAELPDRQVLEDRVRSFEEKFQGREVPRPEHWSGFRVDCRMVEFWYGRAHRLHERLRFTAESDRWEKRLLYP